ncbi:MAG TPA: hypothetical protein DDW34_03860 [Clostridium sp.]|nr:hypothetical protein [Clostridium sp.]
MKQKSKLIAVCVMMLFLSFSPVCAFAQEICNPTPIAISSGLIFEEEKQDATFEDSRIVYGETIPFADISVIVSRKDAEGNTLQDYSESFEVGSLGIFSISLPLKLGTNYIDLSVSSQCYDNATYSFEIKRMPLSVKEQLKTMIALPGIGQKNK